MPPNENIEGTKGAELFILRMAVGDSIKKACEAADISYSTGSKRMMFDTWRNAVKAKREELFEEAEGKLTDSLAAAVGTLSDLLSSESDTARYNAAGAILKSAMAYKQRDSAQKVEVSGPDGGPIRGQLDTSALTPEELASFRELLAKMQGGDGE